MRASLLRTQGSKYRLYSSSIHEATRARHALYITAQGDVTAEVHEV